MSSFNIEINARTPFKGLAFNTNTYKLTAKYKKFIRENDGFYKGFDLLTGQGLAYNPNTKRIVRRSKLYKKNNQPRAVYVDAIEKAQEKKIDFVHTAVNNVATFNIVNMTGDQIENLFSKIPLDVPYLLTVTMPSGAVKYYTLNENTILNILGVLTEVITGDYDGPTFSDTEIVEMMANAQSFTLKQINPSNKSQGAFFKYTLRHSLPDVEKYGLFDVVDSANYEECCFIVALRCSGLVSDEKIEAIKCQVKNAFMPMCKIKGICEQFGLHINVKGLTNTRDMRRYGDKSKPEIKMGLFEQHYFYIEKTQITKYALTHYDELQARTLAKPWHLYRRANETDESRCMDTLALFKCLLNDVKNQFLEPIKMSAELMATPYHEKINEFPALFCEQEYAPAVDHTARNDKIEKKRYYQEYNTRVWFDFETTTDGDKHVPYLCCYVDDNGNKCTFYGAECGKYMLNDLHKKYYVKNSPNSITMFAHNLTYDFITGVAPYLVVKSTIEKGSNVMMASASFYGLKIKLQDTYALITAPLAKFGKMFELEQCKEVMPYDVYTKKRMQQKRPRVEMAECLQALKEDERDQFVSNCKKWLCVSGQSVDIVKYSALYCMMDCDVLMGGYKKFHKMITDVCGLDVDHYVSNASIADDFLVSRGCFDGCVQVNGITRAFIQKCLVGGRTMSANNKKQKLIKRGTRVSDFDAVSLYPSAMKRLNGFLLGSPRLVDGEMTDYENLKKASGFYVRVKILAVPIRRAFPLLSYINDKGVRIFSNDMAGKTVFIDNVALADAIEFQGVQFEVIDGYYFNDGFNPKITDVIQEVFAARLVQKAKKNPMEQIYKLIMNSSYGKTCLKEINEKYDYVSNKDFKKFMERQYNWIKKAVPCENGQGYRITSTNPINDHVNRVHIGIQILSMSKRIMNEVMCTAEDIGARVYYQDTDSMHIKVEDVEKVQHAFNQKYGRELIGKGMGQFHTDFEMDGCENIYSEKFVALGKKCYLDRLVGFDKKTGEKRKGYHLRLKGVPNGSILAECKRRKCTPYALYTKMYKGQAITFDLLKNEHGKKIRFKKGDNMTFSTVPKFERKVKF